MHKDVATEEAPDCHVCRRDIDQINPVYPCGVCGTKRTCEAQDGNPKQGSLSPPGSEGVFDYARLETHKEESDREPQIETKVKNYIHRQDESMEGGRSQILLDESGIFIVY